MPDFIEFPEQNTIIAKDQPQYLPIPAYKTDNANGQVIFKVKLKPEELQKLWNETNGEFFISLLTFNQPMQPINIMINSPFVTLYKIEDTTPENLLQIIEAGCKIGNYHIGRDTYIFDVVAIIEGRISIKMLNPSDTTNVLSTRIYTWIELSQVLKSSKHPDQWFYFKS